MNKSNTNMQVIPEAVLSEIAGGGSGVFHVLHRVLMIAEAGELITGFWYNGKHSTSLTRAAYDFAGWVKSFLPGQTQHVSIVTVDVSESKQGTCPTLFAEPTI